MTLQDKLDVVDKYAHAHAQNVTFARDGNKGWTISVNTIRVTTGISVTGSTLMDALDRMIVKIMSIEHNKIQAIEKEIEERQTHLNTLVDADWKSKFSVFVGTT